MVSTQGNISPIIIDVFPLRRPDLFKGCRSPGRGLLLFGPPVSAKFSYRCYKFQRPAL